MNHPHICTIHEVGEADGQAYIAMEYVEGQTLRALVAPGGLAVETVLRYGTQIADGNLLYYTSDRDGYRCIRAQRLDPKTKRPVGPPIDSHSARRSLTNAGIEFLEISLSSDKLVFNLGEITGNVWMAKLEGSI